MLRGGQLGITYIEQDYDEKHLALEKIIAEAAVSADKCAFVGDDTPDIEVLERVGLAVAGADAHEKVKLAAHYITKHDGGVAAGQRSDRHAFGLKIFVVTIIRFMLRFSTNRAGVTQW